MPLAWIAETGEMASVCLDASSGFLSSELLICSGIVRAGPFVWQDFAVGGEGVMSGEL
jgi:hypothetical protein